MCINDYQSLVSNRALQSKQLLDRLDLSTLMLVNVIEQHMEKVSGDGFGVEGNNLS